ncbi:high-affinity branched-chain amino acid transport ATP-binding protein LivF [Oxobacter pfennigii]|uniref:High-affinity branched-chain amino acid transport ATP-binding protein LivF n=1 Tax=Oxobacter pfennigii TaxID=36849 RepID=A0A0P8YAN6_9CLOT|nr:ABC transporter ATP-binding protein [Oxobacter pfennigii]KPU44066.1 high-affinity branched-chain amino acid transport ATP-binding protein LivF [Oxobacter pfennigii]
MLDVKDINVYYGNIHAIKGISFSVKEKEVVTLIGANGAGKTTTIRAVSSLEKVASGEITYKGKDITNAEASSIVAMGLCQVPEGRRIFPRMSVRENLELGAYLRKDVEKIRRDYELVYEKFPRLKERINQIAGTLSGGEQQMLAIGRALMSNPELLLLDEPSMGLSPLLVKEIFKIIKEINEEGRTVLLVEQNAHMALSIANRAYVLETGSIVLEGDAKEVMENEDVKKAYLGD